jgi:hypothetical protein
VRGQKKFANAQRTGTVRIEPEAAEVLSKFLENLPHLGDSGKPLNYEEVATQAGLSGAYDVHYRSLSLDAAHPSLVSLKRCWESSENYVTFRWGPNVNDVKETLVAACTAMWYLIAWMAEPVEQTEIKQKVASCSGELKRLIENEKSC